jgi:hypothetical protein
MHRLLRSIHARDRNHRDDRLADAGRPVTPTGSAGRMVGKEYVRAMGAFLTNDCGSSRPSPAGHHSGGRSLHAVWSPTKAMNDRR